MASTSRLSRQKNPNHSLTTQRKLKTQNEKASKTKFFNKLLIGAGNSNKLIADQLSIGEATVKSHVTNILSKLGANDRAHAVTTALKRGIIEL